MYYSHPCSYCGKIFCTYSTDKWAAAQKLYYGIKKHLVDYDEDRKEYQFDDGHSMDSNEIYSGIVESNDRPSGAYEI